MEGDKNGSYLIFSDYFRIFPKKEKEQILRMEMCLQMAAGF
jgi:hypothetical protein